MILHLSLTVVPQLLCTLVMMRCLQVITSESFPMTSVAIAHAAPVPDMDSRAEQGEHTFQ